MIKFWTNCYEAVRFTCEAQAVISVRLMLFASGDPNAAGGSGGRWFPRSFKFSLCYGQAAAEQALADWLGLYEAAERAYLPLRHRVHENSQRRGGL